MKKIVLLAFVSMLLSTVLVVPIRLVVAEGTIYIRSDGSVDPVTAPIHRDGDVYTFTDNIYQTIEVQKDNIVIDGKSYTLQDQIGQLHGFFLNDRSGVTIKNTNIMGFDYGFWLSRSSDNIISGNNITHNYNGIFMTLFSGDNTVKNNNITNNANFGISIAGDSSGNVIYHNVFINNTYQQANSQLTNTWDNGAEGNYWSDYTGVDSDGDAIGDTPYMIEEGNEDRYPLMNPLIPEEKEEEEEEVPFWMEWWFWVVITTGIVALAGAVYFLKKRKPPTPIQ